MDNQLKSLLNKKWYFQGFNGTPALLEGAARSAVHAMPKTLGFGYSAIIEYFEDDKCYFLYAWDDLFAIREQLLKKVKQDKTYLSFLIAKDEELCNKSLAFYKKIDAMDLAMLSDAKLASLYQETDVQYELVLGVSHMVEGFTLTTEETIRKKVKQAFSHDSEAMLKVLAAPLWPSFLGKEHYDLYLIARELNARNIHHLTDAVLQKHPSIAGKIHDHQKKYFWKNNGYASAKILGVEDFIQEINEIFEKQIDVDQKIAAFESIGENKEKKATLLAKIQDDELKELIAINDVIFRVHDHRKEVMTISLHYLYMLLTEISRRSGIPQEVIRYIKSEEFGNAASLKNVLEERRKKSVFVFLPKKTVVLDGEEATTYINELNAHRTIEEKTIIKGNSACMGKARGIVKVCRGEKEISKIQQGNILVACMTQPEFVPAMKKAAAVVTDEGGLTCHAAIICRELKIPCIIGTKIGTQVLKDGMLVEVDADKGIVTIIKQP